MSSVAERVETDTSPSEETVLVRPTSGWVFVDFKELWRYRELFYFLAWRDIKVRYKQTVLGAAWAVLQPVITMIIFSIFFGRLAKIPSDGVPYPIFAYTALIPWTFFAFALTNSSNSLVGGASLITKVYFPRLAIPVSSVIAGLLDFGIAFIVLIGMMLFYGIYPTPAVIALPFFVLLTLVTVLGIGLWLSALNVEYRDIRYTVPFLTQVWMFATPIAYPSSMVPEQWRIVYGLNPMAGVVEGFRWALLGVADPSGPMLAVSTTVAVLMLVSGMFYFRRMERKFADII
ncbi:MAG: ABC transporter permease [Dehalococcoidia bacterium]|nr:ABC transporter permease [Dehalococcoidia bacterium]